MTLPRRTRPTTEKRVNTALSARAAQSMQGATSSARPREARGRTVRESQMAYAEIEHRDDPDVVPPPAALVYWKGAATPNNGQDHHFWYTEND